MRVLLLKVAFFLAANFCSLYSYAKNYEVKMLNNGEEGFMSFSPGFLKVNPGDTVTFLPRHLGHNASLSFSPQGVKPWKSEYNEKFTVTLDREGVYIYVCEPHLRMAMVGVIQVGKAHNKFEAVVAANIMQKKFMFSKDRLTQYLELVK